MLIDWFTVIAQIVNFLILVYLLKRFLYQPILKAIDEREKRIASQLEDAAKQKTEATEEREQYKQLNQDLNHKKDALIKEAQTIAETERHRLLDKAEQEYANLRKKLEESFTDQQAKLSYEMKRHTQQEVFDIARKVLTDLADTTLESQIVAIFLEKLKNLKKPEIDSLFSTLKKSKSLTIRSAFDLTSDQQRTITHAINELIQAEVPLEFRTAAEEVAGIELYSGGYKIAWTIAEYLNSLEKRVAEIAKVVPERHPTPIPTSHDK